MITTYLLYDAWVRAVADDTIDIQKVNITSIIVGRRFARGPAGNNSFNERI